MKKQLPCLSFRKALLAFEEIVIVDFVIIKHRFACLAGLQPIPATLRGPHPSVQIVASQSHHHMNFAPAKIDDVGWDQGLPDLLVEVHTIHWWVQDFHRVKTVLKLLLGNLHSFFNTVHFGQDFVHHVSSCQFTSHPPWVPRALRPCWSTSQKLHPFLAISLAPGLLMKCPVMFSGTKSRAMRKLPLAIRTSLCTSVIIACLDTGAKRITSLSHQCVCSNRHEPIADSPISPSCEMGTWLEVFQLPTHSCTPKSSWPPFQKDLSSMHWDSSSLTSAGSLTSECPPSIRQSLQLVHLQLIPTLRINASGIRQGFPDLRAYFIRSLGMTNGSLRCTCPREASPAMTIASFMRIVCHWLESSFFKDRRHMHHWFTSHWKWLPSPGATHPRPQLKHRVLRRRGVLRENDALKVLHSFGTAYITPYNAQCQLSRTSLQSFSASDLNPISISSSLLPHFTGFCDNSPTAIINPNVQEVGGMRFSYIRRIIICRCGGRAQPS